MRNNMFRAFSLATIAVIAAGAVTPSYADGWPSSGVKKQSSRKAVVRRAASRPLVRERVVERIIEKPVIVEKIIEKPVIVEKIVEKPAVVEETAAAAVVDAPTPVIIDRYEKRRRSLIRLGLFPFSLLD
jgi:hypothetical protein